MALIAYSSSQIELLADQLCATLCEQIRQNPLRAFHIAAPNHRLIRWLNNRIADQLGICLNVRFVYLENLLQEAHRQDHGLSRRDIKIHWTNTIFNEKQNEKDTAESESTRLKQSWELAGMFDQYAEHRPEWLLNNPSFSSAPGNSATQRQYWQTITKNGSSPQHPILNYIENRKDVQSPSLETLHLFGFWASSPAVWDMLLQIIGDIEAYWYLPLPSSTYLVDLAKTHPSTDLFTPGDEDNSQSRYQMLARFARMGKAMQVQLLDYNIDPIPFTAPKTAQPNLLQALQTLISDPDSLNPENPQALKLDNSMQIHSASSLRRELEIAKTCILDAIRENPGIRLEDIAVYAPNIDDYATLIPAVFNEAETENQLVYHIHQSLAPEENPFFQAFFKWLELADDIWSLPTLLEWMRMPPLKKQFGWEDGDIEIIGSWLQEAGAFLGRSSSPHKEDQSGTTLQFTLDSGIQRLLGAYSQGTIDDSSHTWRAVANQPELLESFITFIHAFDTANRELMSSAKTAAHWQQLIERHVNLFFDLETHFGEYRILQESLTRLSSLFGDQAQHTLQSFSQFLKYHLPYLPLETAQSRRSGLIFSSIRHQNLIPSRVTLLLGMNEGQFPQTDTQSSIDLIQQDSPRLNDPSAKNEDRYWLLQSLLQTKDQWIAIYQGSNLQNTEPLPLSPEIEYIQMTVEQELPKYYQSGDSIQLAIRQHPRFPYEAIPSGYSQFEAQQVAASDLISAKAPPKPFVDAPLHIGETHQTLTLNTLAKWLTQSARYYCENILGIKIPDVREDGREHEPFIWYSNSLENYRIHSIIREGLLQNQSPQAIQETLSYQGLLPDASVSDGWFNEHLNTHQQWLQAMPPEVEILNPAEDLDYAEIGLGDHTLLGCSLIDGIEHLGVMRSSKYRIRDLLETWLLCLCLNASDNAKNSVHVYYFAKDRWASVNPPDDAYALLHTLVELFGKYQVSPLPFYPEISQIAFKMPRPDSAKIRSHDKWASREYFGESHDPYIKLSLQNREPFGDDFWEVATTIYKPLFEHLNTPKRYDPV